MAAGQGSTGPHHRAILSWETQTWDPWEPVHVLLKAGATQQRPLLAPPGCPTHPGRQGRKVAPSLALEPAKQEAAGSTAKLRQASCQAERPQDSASLLRGVSLRRMAGAATRSGRAGKTRCTFHFAVLSLPPPPSSMGF